MKKNPLSRYLCKFLATLSPFAIAVSVTAQTPQPLPYSYNSGRTNMTASNGWSYTGVGTDYADATTPIKFDTTGDVATLSIASAPNQVSFYLKGNSFSGGLFTLLESSDGTAFTTVKAYSNNITSSNTLFTELLASSTRFIRWLYSTKVSGNVGLGTISLTAAVTGPTITAFAPSTGSVGDTVVISGANFGATPAVFFNGIAASSNVNPAGTEITATVPSDATTGKITVEVEGQTTATSLTDFIVVAPGTPIVSLSTNSITSLSTSTGVASAATNYSVTGTNLGVTPVTVTPDSTLLEIGTNGTDFTNALSLAPVGGVVSNSIFLRVVATNVVTNYTASVSHVSGSASSSLAVSGAITNLPPVLAVSTNALSGFTTTTNVPSIAQSFTVTGSNLTSNVTVGAPNGFQVANDDVTWGTNTSLTPVSGTVSNTVSVRLAASSVPGPLSGNVTVASTGATQRTVAVSGLVESPSVPGLVYWNFNSATPTSGTNGAYASWTFGPLTQGNNLGTTTLFTSTSASSGYTNPFGVVASGTTNAGAAARTGAFNAASNAFFEMHVVVPSNTTTSITNISFGSRSTGTGPAAYSIRSSADGFAADVATNTLTTNSTWAMNVAPVAIALSNGTNTVRIYGYAGSGNASSNTANWRIDDLTLALAAGVGPTPTPPTITSTNAFLGTVGVAFSNDITATGDAPIAFSGTALPGGLSVASGGAITGTPTAAGTFNATLTATNAAGTNTQAVTFTIAKGTVSITAPPNASIIVDGQTLASSTLSGGSASVSGAFAWADSGIVPPVGTTSYGVTFTPADAANYNTAATNASVTVLSAYQAGYSSWLTEFQLDPLVTTGPNAGAPNADPDNDGFSNASEYAFGTNPTVPNGALLTTSSSNSVFRSSWAGPASGVSYGVWSTTNLASTAFTNDPTAPILTNGGVMSFTNQATGNKFFRVRATSN